jgi:hypothetical protein
MQSIADYFLSIEFTNVTIGFTNLKMERVVIHPSL